MIQFLQKVIYTISFLLITNVVSYAQIQGTISDENGEPLPYVNIYVKNTSMGTTSNFDGAYNLKLPIESYNIIFQSVGYTPITKKINYTGEVISLDIQLIPQKYELASVEINADAEDPAYAIIRKAQSKRKYYASQMGEYECDAYVKGFNKVLSAPKKILGQEVGDMDGALDSTRQGVVYLSESVSKLYVKDGNSKEIMYSSKISGDDNGYSFNSAQEMDFNFYNNNLDLNKKVISPIAAGAMSYYKYALEGTQYDENGQLVNKIKVIPKNEYSPAFYGYIYFNEDLWNIHSLELGLTSKSIQLPFIDSLIFQQVFVPVQEEKWMPLSNVIKFKMGAMGFQIAGNFACVYSNYIIDNVDSDIFNNEIFKVEREANNLTETYWDSIRPIPLTTEERVDYKRKDSIQIVRKSPAYLDSIDRKNNKFSPLDILTGYSYQNSQNRTQISYSSVIPSLQINTIQGINFSFNTSYSKSYDEDNNKRLNINGSANYGFSEKVFRPEIKLDYRANRTNNFRLRIHGGKALSQYNSAEPISNSLNSIMTYFLRRNYLKAYDKEFVSLILNRYIGKIFYGQASLTYENRSAVTNRFDNSLFYKDDRRFTSNNPQNLSSDVLAFSDHQALIFRAALRIRIGQKIWTYPDQIYRAGTDWPTLWIFYKKAIRAAGGDVDYDLISANISDYYSIGTTGDMSINVTGGKFLRSNNISFIDYNHFEGNQTHIGDPYNYRNRFLLLPYYSHSSIGTFGEAHIQHNFNGFLLNRVPVLRKLGWQLVAGAKHLRSSQQEPYSELHIGLDNIGIHLFRLLRVDAVWAMQSVEEDSVDYSRFGVVVGFKMDL